MERTYSDCALFVGRLIMWCGLKWSLRCPATGWRLIELRRSQYQAHQDLRKVNAAINVSTVAVRARGVSRPGEFGVSGPARVI